MSNVPQVHHYMSRRGKQRYLARGAVLRGPRAPTLLPQRPPCLRCHLVRPVGRPKPLLRQRVRPRGVALRLWRKEATRTAAWGRSGKLASCAVEKDLVEGCHLESGSNPPTVPAQRPSDVISTYRMATQAKATSNILTGAGTGAGTGIGGGAKSEVGGSCVPGI
jgi:hypothetical protein